MNSPTSIVKTTDSAIINQIIKQSDFVTPIENNGAEISVPYRPDVVVFQVRDNLIVSANGEFDTLDYIKDVFDETSSDSLIGIHVFPVDEISDLLENAADEADFLTSLFQLIDDSSVEYSNSDWILLLKCLNNAGYSPEMVVSILDGSSTEDLQKLFDSLLDKEGLEFVAHFRSMVTSEEDEADD